jgi:hypothetical protein
MAQEETKKKGKAIFLVGFNNWGKTTLIKALFNQSRFLYERTYNIPGINSLFCVQSQSNDDVGELYQEQIERRFREIRPQDPDLFTTICPSLERRNHFINDILTRPAMERFSELHFLFLRFKWDHHAELLIDNIITSISNPMVTVPRFFHTIDADLGMALGDRLLAKTNQAMELLRLIYA